MKYFIIFLISVTIFIITNPAYAMCAYDPDQPHKPCDDTNEILIIDSNQTQIENINGIPYYISEPFLPNSPSNEKIIFHDVFFSLPYKYDPPRHIYSDVIFSDGTKETLSILFDEPDFTDHIKPQAGLIGTLEGYRFLISVDLKELSPLKQFNSGIPIAEIQCKEGLELILKSLDDSPACVTPETKQILIERGWAKDYSHVQDSLVNHRDLYLIERYKDMPEVKAFYDRYDDASVSVREDHVSYFAGNEDDFRVRMDLYFDENYDLEYIDFHCYVGRQHKTEVAQEDILSYLENYDCKE